MSVDQAVAARPRIGVLALVAALVALIFAVTPTIAGFTFLFSFTGIVLAIIGITQRETRRKIAAVALVIAVVACPVSAVVFTAHVLETAFDPCHRIPGPTSACAADS